MFFVGLFFLFFFLLPNPRLHDNLRTHTFFFMKFAGYVYRARGSTPIVFGLDRIQDGRLAAIFEVLNRVLYAYWVR